MNNNKIIILISFILFILTSLLIVLLSSCVSNSKSKRDVKKDYKEKKCAEEGDDIWNPIFKNRPLTCCNNKKATPDNKGTLRCPSSGGDAVKKCINFNQITKENINCCDGTPLTNNICKSKCSFSSDCDMGNGKDKKVIVVRHACDLDNWSFGNYVSFLPLDKKQYNLQGLSDFGCEQAHALAVALPKFIKEKGYAPITEVSVQDPSPSGETSNPFRTIFNLVKSCNIQNLTFTDTKSVGGTGKNVNITSDTNGSLLLCYTSQVINGVNKRINNPEPDSILYKLQKHFNIPEQIMGPPWKAYTIYVFSEGIVEYYHLDKDKKEIVKDGWSGNKPC